MIICIPDPAACCDHHGHHWCDLQLGHQIDHHCNCPQGAHWPRDLIAELRRIAYLAANTVPYRVMPEIPSEAVVAAGSGPDTRWHRVAVAVARYMGVVL